MNIFSTHVLPIARRTPNGTQVLGTCFNLSVPGLFATAFHVTNYTDNGLYILMPGQDNDLDSYQSTEGREIPAAEVKIIAADPIHDLCILQTEGSLYLTTQYKGTDSLSTLEKVVVVGYPHATHGRRILTLCDPTIGAKLIISKSSIPVKHIVLNLQTRPGQSGSPVFSLNSNGIDSLIGILIGSYAIGDPQFQFGDIDPRSLNQTSYAVSSEYLIDML
jgi:V8-like Glu-specific endopeptidase